MTNVTTAKTATPPKTVAPRSSHGDQDPTIRSWQRLRRRLAFLLVGTLAPFSSPQSLTGPQQLVFAGLHSVGAHGQFNAVQAAPDGSLYLLLDQKDGVRVLKTDPAATTILAEAQLGAAGDIGISLAIAPTGDIYVSGTTSSNALAGTPSAAFPARSDATTNSFVARFDAGLHPVAVTFAGDGRLAATSLAVTAQAVFLTGVLFNATLPVTPGGIQPAPTPGSQENGFVERFTLDLTTLVYATYLTGANGDTAPAAIVADPSGNAYIAGYTTAAGFPAVAALFPRIAPAAPNASTMSGFLTRLAPAGDAFLFSTFLPGTGVSSLALDAASSTLLLSGTLDLGRIPIATVTGPLVDAAYQSVLRLPLDGSAILASTVLAPGPASTVVAGASGSAWVAGTLSTPLLPLTPLAQEGNAFAVRVTAAGNVDQTARFGGLPATSPAESSAPVLLTSIAVDPSGQPLLAGAFTPTTEAARLALQRYDLPLVNAPNAAFPASPRDAALLTGACSGSLCAGFAAFLAQLHADTSAPALALSTGASPDLLLRNLGSAPATGLQVLASGFSLASTCATHLDPGAECSITLSGTGPGTLTMQADNAPAQTVSLPASDAAPTTIVFSPRELDFGVQTAFGPAVLRTVTVTNLAAASQTFVSALDGGSPGTPSPFSESFSDCPSASGPASRVLAPGASCQITLAFTLTASLADGPIQAQWKIAADGAHDVLLTGFAQAAPLSASSTQVSFGTRFTGGIETPRFLYLSNNSAAGIPHAPVALPPASPFNVMDRCPSTLPPHSICQLQLTYAPSAAVSDDALSLILDNGISVLITGQSLPAPAAGAVVNPDLNVTPASILFENSVPVTGRSSTTQTVTVSNTGVTGFPLSVELTGDFASATSCTASLSAGQSCAVVLSFTPTAPGVRQGVLVVTAGLGTTPLYVDLSGTATAILPASNGTLDFGAVPMTQPTVRWFKISQPFQNLHVVASGPYKAVLAEDTGFGHGSPAPAAFRTEVSSTCLNCFLGVQFQPTGSGSQNGALSLASSSITSPYILALTGVGLPLTGLVASPYTQDFGTVSIKSTSRPYLLSLANLTTAAATLTGVTLSGDFAVSPAATGGTACSGTLAPGATCLVQLTFSPSAGGQRTGMITFASSAGSTSARLTGFGAPDPGLALTPTSILFQNVPGPDSNRQSLTLTNTSTVVQSIAAPTTTGSGFSATSTCSVLAPGASCTMLVTFVPASSVLASGTLQIPVTTMFGGLQATATYLVPLTGAYTGENAALQIVPSTVNFGPARVGASGTTHLFTVNNLTAEPLPLNLVAPRQFALATANPCPALAPNGSCAFSITHLPATASDATGSVFARSTAAAAATPQNAVAYLQAYGDANPDAALTITGPFSPGTGLLDFGQVPFGQSASQTLTITNAAVVSAPITIRRVTSPPPFLTTTTCGTALVPKQACTVTVTYTPFSLANGGSTPAPAVTDTGTLTLESDAPTSPNLLTLTGNTIPGAGPGSSQPVATLTLSKGSVTFPVTAAGTSSPPETVTLTNTGNVVLPLGTPQLNGDFTATSDCPAALIPAATCTLALTFTPQAMGARAGTVEIPSTSTTSLDFVTLSGNSSPATIAVSPHLLDFGSVLLGTSTTLPVTITNSGPLPVSLSSITLTGDYTAASDCPTPGSPLQPGQACTIQVTFTPTATGTRTGTLSLISTASATPEQVALTGNGTQPLLQVTPTVLFFGSQLLGTPASRTLTLTNSGTAPVTSLAFTLSNGYSVSDPCPVTNLGPRQSCVVTITFLPTLEGPLPGTLTITSSVPAIAVPLSGTGISAGSFTLTVDRPELTIRSGNPATYLLTATPSGSFNASVLLTCAPVTPVPFTNCGILPSSLTLSGSPGNATLTINTLTTVNPVAIPFTLIPGALLLFVRRRRRVAACLLLLATLGCGGGPNLNLRYTNPGSYQFHVTATSTTSPALAQSLVVTLNVTN